MGAAKELLDDQQKFITDLQSSSGTMQGNAMNNILSSRPANVTYTPYVPPQPFRGPQPPKPPTFTDIGLDLPQDPDKMGKLVEVSEANQDTAPTFTDAPPTLEFGNTPNALAEFQGRAPGLTSNFEFPQPPGGLGNVIPLPVLSTPVMPDAPTIAAVNFDELSPINDAAAPTDLNGTFASAFTTRSQETLTGVNAQLDAYLKHHYPEHHSQVARIEAQLTKYLAGGTGLKAEVEDAIYARGRAKNDAEAQRVQNSALADMAARGFTLPSGVGNATMARARQDAANNNAKMVNEIAIAQAEMEQKNLQFAVTTSAALRATAIQSMLGYMQSVVSIHSMALDYAKGILGAVVQVYDLQIKSFSLKLDAYKAAANVYDIKVRASGQLIEIYKGQLQAVETLVGVDRTKVDIYKAQIDSMKSLSDLYKTQVEVVVSKASLEKLKIDLFQAQVQTYAVQVQAKNSEWQGYQARLSGEEAKAKIFTAQVEAFNGKVGAYKSKTDGISEKIKSEAARNNATIQEYAARVSAYEAQVRAKTAVASGNIENQRQRLTGYKGEIDYAIADASMALEAYKANVQAAATNATTSAQVQLENAKVGVASMGALSTVFGEILKVYSGPATAAAAGMVALASINEDV